MRQFGPVHPPYVVTCVLKTSPNLPSYGFEELTSENLGQEKHRRFLYRGLLIVNYNVTIISPSYLIMAVVDTRRPATLHSPSFRPTNESDWSGVVTRRLTNHLRC